MLPRLPEQNLPRIHHELQNLDSEQKAIWNLLREHQGLDLTIGDPLVKIPLLYRLKYSVLYDEQGPFLVVQCARPRQQVLPIFAIVRLAANQDTETAYQAWLASTPQGRALQQQDLEQG